VEEGRLAYRVRTAEAGDAKAWVDLFLAEYASGPSREELRKLVMDCWDPIGVLQGSPGEYDRYLPSMVFHLDSGDGANALQADLCRFRTKNMGLPSRPDLDAAAALTIIDWYQNRSAQPATRDRALAPGRLASAITGDRDADQFFADPASGWSSLRHGYPRATPPPGQT